ncbi:MAG: hypothetical protein QW035_04160 [Candidatus Anstonellales archaeon]
MRAYSEAPLIEIVVLLFTTAVLFTLFSYYMEQSKPISTNVNSQGMANLIEELSKECNGLCYVGSVSVQGSLSLQDLKQENFRVMKFTTQPNNLKVYKENGIVYVYLWREE